VTRFRSVLSWVIVTALTVTLCAVLVMSQAPATRVGSSPQVGSTSHSTLPIPVDSRHSDTTSAPESVTSRVSENRHRIASRLTRTHQLDARTAPSASDLRESTSEITSSPVVGNGPEDGGSRYHEGDGGGLAPEDPVGEH
jgi:hypothetical protein